MRYPRAFVIVAALASLSAPALAALPAAPAVAGYDLSWHTMEGGGSSSSEGYALAGALGQPDAGRLSDGAYTLSGGFLAGAPALRSMSIYLPLILRNP